MRYDLYTAHNLAGEPQTIDVHRLKVPEAVRETEKAIRDLLVEGGDTLRVVTGRDIEDVHDAHPYDGGQGGRDSMGSNGRVNPSAGTGARRGRIPVLKLALIRTMEG